MKQQLIAGLMSLTVITSAFASEKQSVKYVSESDPTQKTVITVNPDDTFTLTTLDGKSTTHDLSDLLPASEHIAHSPEKGVNLATAPYVYSGMALGALIGLVKGSKIEGLFFAGMGASLGAITTAAQHPNTLGRERLALRCKAKIGRLCGKPTYRPVELTDNIADIDTEMQALREVLGKINARDRAAAKAREEVFIEISEASEKAKKERAFEPNFHAGQSNPTEY